MENKRGDFETESVFVIGRRGLCGGGEDDGLGEVLLLSL